MNDWFLLVANEDRQLRGRRNAVFLAIAIWVAFSTVTAAYGADGVKITPEPNADSQAEAAAQFTTQGDIKIGIETDNLPELPFDRPFTMSLTFENVDLRGSSPTLRYEEFRRRLDIIPADVCQNQNTKARQATFAGVTYDDSGNKPMSKARFLITGVPPNRYWLFCFDTEGAFSLELTEGAKEQLQDALVEALWAHRSEIEPSDRVRLNQTVEDILNLAILNFTRSRGMSGTYRLNPEIAKRDLVGSLLELRRGVDQCSADTLRRNLSSAEAFFQEIQDRREALPVDSNSGRVKLNQCLDLLKFAKETVSAAETVDPAPPVAAPVPPAAPNAQPAEQTPVQPTAPPAKKASVTQADVDSMLSRISRSLSRLGELELVEDGFVAQALPLLQRHRALILSSSIGGDSVAERYISGDTGLAYVPDLDRSVPYQGINLYLRPVNPPSVTPLGSGQQGNFAQRFSFTLGLTVTGDLKQKETLPSGDEVTFVDDWTDAGSLLVGVGYRLSPALRVGTGAILYRQLDSLVDLEDRAGTEVSYYVSVSLDVNLMRFFRNDSGGIFSGGSPVKTQDSE